ncbi:hypothetical protein HK097_002296, partial [Rhizophlyctis rosea]
MAPSILDNKHQAKMMDEPQHYQTSPQDDADADKKEFDIRAHHAPALVRRHSTAKPLESAQTKRSAPDGRRPPQGVYVGIEFEPMGDSPCFAIYVHDGFYGMDYTIQMLDRNLVEPRFVERSSFSARDQDEDAEASESSEPSDSNSDPSSSDESGNPSQPTDTKIDINNLHEMETAIIEWLKTYSQTHHVRIMAAGIGIESTTVPSPSSSPSHTSRPTRRLSSNGTGQLRICMHDLSLGHIRLHTRLWFELDIIPIVVETKGASIDERACSAARKAEMLVVQPGNIPRVQVGHRHQVEVDGDGKIRMVDLEDYGRTVGKETWGVLMKLTERIKFQNLRFAFFNSTPQGGGVALMRHAIIRFFHLLNVDARWYVMKPNPEIFDITKRKFHNVLQGVGQAELTEEDKGVWEWWCRDNLGRYWRKVVQEVDVVVIDDPQPAGMIPLMKKLNPKLKIIYRSHIEEPISPYPQLTLHSYKVRSDLARDTTTPQHRTWSYLWSFIQHCDAFISHPVASFVPDMVPKEKLAMMPATTDLLDGLNKELDEASVLYYQCVFNRTSMDATGKKADFTGRPYVVQIARFDPSKGIPDVIHAYHLLRSHLPDSTPPEKIPQLILAGHGSIDDPDGNLVFEQVLEMLEREEYKAIKDDVIAARLPPSDQLLNTLMRGALVALQLSTREGFEIKVTEALAKGVPVIAYASGGIPHQIQDGRTGFLVKTGDVEGAAKRLFELVTDEDLRKRMGKSAVECVGEEYFTVFQSVSWLYLIDAVHNNRYKGSTEPPEIGDALMEKDE